MSNLEEIVRKRVNEVIENYGELNYIIYPFGEYGKMVKAILNVEFGIREKMIIDNKLSNHYQNTISDISQLKYIDKEKDIVLVTSRRYEIHEDLIKKLEEYDIKYADMFREECEEEHRVRSNDSWNEIWAGIEKRADEVTKKIEKLGLINNYCYEPQNTKSKFYLPFVFMDMIQQEIFLKEDYKDRKILDYIFEGFNKGIIKKYIAGHSAIDAGANIGNHTLFFLNEMPVKFVYSYEPVKQTFDILRENVLINKLEDKVTLYNCGLGDEETNASIPCFNYWNIGGTGLDTNVQGMVPVHKLDTFEFSDTIRFLKIDVEGMELKVINGGKELIKKDRPVVMIESFEKYDLIKDFFNQYQYDDISLGPNDYLFFPKELL